tara:strand:- start:910 stop:1350 length:441 start_codon:yes stop_codon:yes gene_type:complete
MSGGIKISKQDRIFSKLIRERAGWKCERCGTQYDAHSAGLHCSHIFTRRAVGCRWLPDNACAQCYACHMWFGSNPILGGEWAKEYLGADKLNTLRRRFHATTKLSKADKEEIYTNLKAEYDRLLSLRAQGKTGRLEFNSPYDMEVA